MLTTMPKSWTLWCLKCPPSQKSTSHLKLKSSCFLSVLCSRQPSKVRCCADQNGSQLSKKSINFCYQWKMCPSNALSLKPILKTESQFKILLKNLMKMKPSNSKSSTLCSQQFPTSSNTFTSSYGKPSRSSTTPKSSTFNVFKMKTRSYM